MRRSRIALTITSLVSALFLTACNDENDDYRGVNPDQTFISEKPYSKDSLSGASSIKSCPIIWSMYKEKQRKPLR